MDIANDITLIKVNEYSQPLESDKTYSLKSMLDDIKSDKAEIRFFYGICEKDENGNAKWIAQNKVWVIYLEYVYLRKYGWHWERVYYMGKTKRNEKEINDLLGYCALDNHTVYL